MSTRYVCVCVFGKGLEVGQRLKEIPLQAKQSACCICDRWGDRVCGYQRGGRHGHICGYSASCIDPGPEVGGPDEERLIMLSTDPGWLT